MKHAERVKELAVEYGNGREWGRSSADEPALFTAIDAMQSALDDAVAKLAARDAEVERLRPNAERYLWLREQHESSDSGETFCVFEPDYGAHCLRPVESLAGKLDAAIDAALSEEVKADWIEYRGRDDEVKGGE